MLAVPSMKIKTPLMSIAMPKAVPSHTRIPKLVMSSRSIAQSLIVLLRMTKRNQILPLIEGMRLIEGITERRGRGCLDPSV